MNRIEDEQVKFFLEHETRIREWAALKAKASKFVDRFYRSLKSDLDAALSSGRITENNVRSYLIGGKWPGLGLRRQSWPKGGNPDVRLEWFHKTYFPPRGKANLRSQDQYRKLQVPLHKGSSSRLSGIGQVVAGLSEPRPPPEDRFWEDDNLKKYRDYIVETILTTWKDLAPLVNEAVNLSAELKRATKLRQPRGSQPIEHRTPGR